MSKKSKFFISCEEALHICDKSQYGEASAWERFKLNVRLSWCRITKAYVKKNIKLTKLVEESNIEALDISKKEEMEKNLRKEMGKY